MASDETEPAPAAQPCSPCRGTGRVVSGLGGAPHELPCPWCGGSGVFAPGHDAQEHAAEGSTASDA